MHQVHQFLGLCGYYRRFCKGYADIARPLHKLTGKDVKFEWQSCHESAFQKLKELLTNSPILAYPTATDQFILDTDASGDGLGSVLSQVQEGQERVISYYSKLFSKEETRYCVTRKELLAVVASMRNFRHYLYGRPVTVRTDNAAVSFMMSLKEPTGQMARWLEELATFDINIQHRKGRSHNNADALSRRPCKQCGRPDEPVLVRVVTRQQKEKGMEKPGNCMGWMEGWDPATLRDAQLRDQDIGPIMKALEKQESRPKWEKVSAESTDLKTIWGQWERLRIRNGLLMRTWVDELDPDVEKFQFVVPSTYRSEVLRHHHDSPVGGHLGVPKTVEKIRPLFYWPSLTRSVRQHIRCCDACAALKSPPSPARAPMGTFISGSRGERVSLDIMGPLPVTKQGNQFILVIADMFTKWTIAIALPDQEAKTVADALMEHWIAVYGCPRELHSDQGSNFESKIFQEVCDICGIGKTRSSPRHPQSNGQVERYNRTLATMLAIAVDENQTTWDNHLPFVMMAYRSSCHASTGLSPNQLTFGEENLLPMHVVVGTTTDKGGEEVEPITYCDQLRLKLDRSFEVARENLKVSHATSKTRYDLRAKSVKYEVGDLVWLHDPSRKKGVCRKFAKSWKKLYQVLEVLDDVNVKIRKGRRGRVLVVHKNRIKPYLGPDRL